MQSFECLLNLFQFHFEIGKQTNHCAKWSSVLFRLRFAVDARRLVETKLSSSRCSSPDQPNVLVSRATLLFSTSPGDLLPLLSGEKEGKFQFFGIWKWKASLQWQWINSFSHSTSLDWIFAVSFFVASIIDKWFTWPFLLDAESSGTAKLTWIQKQFISGNLFDKVDVPTSVSGR